MPSPLSPIRDNSSDAVPSQESLSSSSQITALANLGVVSGGSGVLMTMEQGVRAKVIQERLGHQDIETTLSIYSHVSPTMQKDASDKFKLVVEKTE